MNIKLVDGTIDNTDKYLDRDALAIELSHNFIQECLKYDIPTIGIFLLNNGRPRFITHIHSFAQNKETEKGKMAAEVKKSEIDPKDHELYSKRFNALMDGIKYWIENATQGNVTIAFKKDLKETWEKE